MARNVIVSEETLRSLVEQNAAMAAWYHEFVRASREQTPVMTPRHESVGRFLSRMADEFPELATLVRSMSTPAAFSPPPLDFVPVGRVPDASPLGQNSGAGRAQAQSGADKPPLVNPRNVKY